jgi:hypothetical protein
MRDEIEEVLEARQSEWGDAGSNFRKTGRIWGALLGLPYDIPAYQVALMMDAFKSVRCIANPEMIDSWNDKGGYTSLGLEIVLKANEPRQAD